MTNKKTIQRVVAGGLLIENNKILLLKRSAKEKVFPNLWELPSGKKEIKETTQQTLRREFKEETGLDVVCLNPISVFDYTIKKPDEIRETTQINFLVKFSPGKKHTIKISQEHSRYKWVGLTDLDKLYISNKTRQIIKKVL